MINEALQYLQLGSIVVSVVGGYFYIKFKLKDLENQLFEMKAAHKEELISVKASKTAMKNELEKRFDERLEALRERHKDATDAFTKRLDSIESGINEIRNYLITNKPK